MHLLSALSWETISLLVASSVIALGAIYLAGSTAIGPEPAASEDSDEAVVLRKPGKGLLQRLSQESQVETSSESAAEDLSPREYAFRGRHLLASYTGCSESALPRFRGFDRGTARSRGCIRRDIARLGATHFPAARHDGRGVAVGKPRQYPHLSGTSILLCGYLHVRDDLSGRSVRRHVAELSQARAPSDASSIGTTTCLMRNRPAPRHDSTRHSAPGQSALIRKSASILLVSRALGTGTIPRAALSSGFPFPWRNGQSPLPAPVFGRKK